MTVMRIASHVVICRLSDMTHGPSILSDRTTDSVLKLTVDLHVTRLNDDVINYVTQLLIADWSTPCNALYRLR